MIIRPYTTEDFDAVLALIGAVLGEFGFSANIGGAQHDLENIEIGYRAPRGGFWIASLEGKIAGTIAIRPKHDPLCELKRLYVDSRFRGQGIGAALYAHAEAFARDAGYGGIWLDSSRKFTAARKLYEKNGFTLIEELDNDWCDNIYEKRWT